MGNIPLPKATCMAEGFQIHPSEPHCAIPKGFSILWSVTDETYE